MEHSKFHRALQQKYCIRRIRIQVDLDTCLERVRTRSNADHIPASDDKVQEHNRIVTQVVYDWDLAIDNAGPARDRDILAAIQTLLPRHQAQNNPGKENREKRGTITPHGEPL